MTRTIGLDVGGAHLKVAVCVSGRITTVKQIACPLWKGMDRLHQALSAAAPLLNRPDAIGITMTGELSDLFKDRATGVRSLIEALTHAFDAPLYVWCGRHGFGDPAFAAANPVDTGSTNFLASAQFVANSVADGVLIDFGSTTADIIPFRDGCPVPAGTTDAERLTTGELVYTGMTRTSVMAVATRAPFQGQSQTLAREHLATMADVRRVLGELAEGIDAHDTADGRSKSLGDSVARFARMFGRDADEGSYDDWRQAAAFVRDAQVHSIEEDLLRVLERSGLPQSAPIVAAGIGFKTAFDLACRVGRPAQEFGRLASAEASQVTAATCAAPAVAIAHLVAENSGLKAQMPDGARLNE